MVVYVYGRGTLQFEMPPEPWVVGCYVGGLVGEKCNDRDGNFGAVCDAVWGEKYRGPYREDGEGEKTVVAELDGVLLDG